MTEGELQKVTDKLHKLSMLREARERVRQLEQELCGDGAKDAEAPRELLSQVHPLRQV